MQAKDLQINKNTSEYPNLYKTPRLPDKTFLLKYCLLNVPAIKRYNVCRV